MTARPVISEFYPSEALCGVLERSTNSQGARPTIVILRNGSELGRIVKTPAVSLEADLQEGRQNQRVVMKT